MAPTLPANLCEMIKKMAGLNHDWRAEGIADLHEFFSQRPIPSQVTTHNSMMIIWKGLHCAMLHQPDPLKQEELADKISNMIYCFKKEKQVNLFVQTAMETFEREWHTVNVYMVDKMMMFFRRVIRQALFRLADHKWQHSDRFMDMLEATVIRPLDDDHKFKVDVKMHLSSLFMEELAKAHNEYFTHATLMIFLRPYIKVITASRDARYVADVHCNIFQHLIRQSDVGVDSRADLQENEILVKKSGKPVKPTKRGAQQESEDDEDEDEADEGEEEWEDMDGSEEDGEGSEEEYDEEGDSEDEEMEDEEEVSDEKVDEEEDGEYEEVDEEGEEVESMDEQEDDEEEEEGSDYDEEYPLDPRAGNVDVVLPQIEVDYENLVKVLVDIMESESSQMRFKNLRKLRTLIRQLQDVVGNVYPLAQHPTVHPVHKMLEEDVAELDIDKAIQKRINMYEEEFKADPKFKKRNNGLTMEMLEDLYDKSKKIKDIMRKERAHKWMALDLKKRQYEKRKEELKFKKYAKRTLKLKTKVDNRRLKAQGLLLSAEDKQKAMKEKNEEKRRALLNVITNVTREASSALKTSGANSSETTKAVSNGTSSETSKAVSNGTSPKTSKAVSNGTSPKTSKAVSNGTSPKTSKAVSNGTSPKTSKAVSNGTSPKTSKAVSNSTSLKTSKAVSNGTSSKTSKAVLNGSSSKTSKAVSNGTSSKTSKVVTSEGLKSTSCKITASTINEPVPSKKISKGSSKKAVNGSVKQKAETVTSEIPGDKMKKPGHLTKSCFVKMAKIVTPEGNRVVVTPSVEKLPVTISAAHAKKAKSSTKRSGKNKDISAPQLVQSNEKLQELLQKLTSAKRSRSLEQSPVRIAKKQKTQATPVKTSSLASHSPSKKGKKNATTPTSIKINLGENKQHEFNDYRRSILASPAIPFQPDKTPLTSSILKATNSPILVKKPFSRTLRSIPTNAKFESASPTLGQKKMKSKKGKVSPHVLKGLQKKGLSLEGLASTNKSAKLEINVKEKSLKSPKLTSTKPLARKHSHNRPSAADFF